MRHWLAFEAKSLIFGGLDGVCTSLALLWAGVAAGEGAVSAHSLLVMGVAGLISQGFAMGLGMYLGSSIESSPTISFADRPDVAPSALRSGSVMFLSFVGFGAIPLLACIPAFNTFDVTVRRLLLSAATALSLFVLGSLRGVLTKEHTLFAGLSMVGTGFAAASISFCVSAAFQHFLADQVNVVKLQPI
ncbi:hypothetical protein DIPPA_04336 [Diplonema papillatum]|nr:hypothetical protein DIPPA_04336 [Diplonema papillatum]